MARQQRGSAPGQAFDAATKGYVDGLIPAAVTRKASYTFGGCEGTDADWNTSVITQRTRFQLTVQPTRYRVHARNALKLTDAAASATTITGVAAFVGRRNTATRWDPTSAMQSVAAGASSTMTGATQWVSGWTVPTGDMTKPSLLDLQYNITPNMTLATNTASRTLFIFSAKGGTTTTVGTPTTDASNITTQWADLYTSALEVWIEYEYTDSTVTQGLIIGHSFADSCTYFATGPWDGQNAGWPQLAARKNRQAITVDAVGSASSATYAPSSPKWGLFSDHTFDWVLIELAENDVTNGVAQATITANITAIINKIRTLWPNARVYMGNVMANKPQDTNTAHETGRVTFNASINDLLGLGLLDGMIDMERILGLTTDLTTLDSRMLDLNPTVGLRHLSNYGAAVVSGFINIR